MEYQQVQEPIMRNNLNTNMTKVKSQAKDILRIENNLIADPLENSVNIFTAKDPAIQKRNLFMLRDFAKSLHK